MTKRYRIAALLLLAAAILACVPVLYSLHQARKQAIREKYVLLDDVSTSIRREVAGTIGVIERLSAEMRSSGDAPCSSAGLLRMQRFGISSHIVKSTLYLQGGKVVCSSGGALMQQIALPPNPLRAADGVLVYTQVHVPGLPGHEYVILEKDGYALLVYPDGLISPFARPDLSLGLFNSMDGRYAARQGTLLPGWTTTTADTNHDGHFTDAEAGYLVVRRVLRPGGTGVIVATPLATIDTRMAQFAHWFIPIGIVAGLAVLGMALVMIRRQWSTRAELLRAINKGHFFLVYQPVFCLQDDTCIGAEALLRWEHEDGTVVPPDRFIPFAEDAGLIQLVTRRVLELVVQDLSGFFRQYPRFRLGVNLSPRDLQSMDTPRLLAEMQQAIGPGNGQFVVEATERGLLEETSAQDVVAAIHALGIEIAIDDFGTGYSSLAYLTTYPFDILKVDKSFTSTACTEAVTSQVATHIIELASSLNMQTLVEGIESQEQADFFRSRGVLYGQGYFFARPMRAADLAAFVPLHTHPGQHAARPPAEKHESATTPD